MTRRRRWSDVGVVSTPSADRLSGEVSMPRRRRCLPALPFPPPIAIPDLAAHCRAVPLADLVVVADRLLTHLAVAKIVLEARDPAAYDRWWASVKASVADAIATLPDDLDDVDEDPT
jgi:hypothetical protein